MEVGVIETGLGGARDATNVFGDQLQLAIITAVGTEHSAALGACLDLKPQVISRMSLQKANSAASHEQCSACCDSKLQLYHKGDHPVDLQVAHAPCIAW